MLADKVDDRESFIDFLSQLREQLKAGADDWANIKLADFLESMSAWASDSSLTADKNPWTHAASLMQAGAFYE